MSDAGRDETPPDRRAGIGPSDITMVLCVRCHAGNPWILQRLDWLAEHYVPRPPVLIVDFGSEPPFAADIAHLCERHGYALRVVDDPGVFSLAAARNAGFRHSTTEFVFFSDPDFFGERDLFGRLADTARALDMRSVVDIVLDLPAVHLSAAQAQAFERAADPERRGELLRRWAWTSNYAASDKAEDAYVVPYSNVFMMHRNLFSMVGGYDENFRGHGSEDFEFFLRLAMHTGHLPLPPSRTEDLHGPHSEEFFEARPYAGFRRLFELMAQPTESLGLKVLHLWHERQLPSDWYRHRDRGRGRFNAAIARYVDAPHALLGIDHLARAQRLLCCCDDPADWTLFVPLRLAGFGLQPVFGHDAEALAGLPAALLDGEVDGIAVLLSGEVVRPAFADALSLARARGKRVVTLQPGEEPGGLRYVDDDAAPSGAAAVSDARFVLLPEVPASPEGGPRRSVKAVTEFSWHGRSYAMDRLARTLPFDWKSYSAARIAARRTPAVLLRQLRRGLRACHPLDGVVPATLRRWLKRRRRGGGTT